MYIRLPQLKIDTQSEVFTSFIDYSAGMLKPVEILVLSLSKAFGTLNYILSGPKLFQKRAVSSEVRYCNQMRSYIGQAVLNITGTTGLKRTLVQIVEGVAQEFISKQ